MCPRYPGNRLFIKVTFAVYTVWVKNFGFRFCKYGVIKGFLVLFDFTSSICCKIGSVSSA